MQQIKKDSLVAIVDDDPDVRKALQRLLQSTGFKVQTFPAGEDFLRTVGACQPDCLLLDLHLPGLSGFDVIRQLVAMSVTFPVIIITAADGSQEPSLAAGAAAFLLKPLEETELLSAVRKALQN